MKKHLLKLAIVLVALFALQLVNTGDAEAVMCGYARCFSFSSAVLKNGQEEWRFYLTDQSGQVSVDLNGYQSTNLIETLSFGTLADFFSGGPIIIDNLEQLNMTHYDFFTGLSIDLTSLDTVKGSVGSLQEFYYTPAADGLSGTLTSVVQLNNGPTLTSTVALTPVPEPSTIILLGAGLVGLVAVKLRRRKEE